MPETAVPESVSTERPKKAHARETTIRLLQVLAVAALLFPLLLFGYGSWLSYREAKALAIERIGHSLDVMQEQALKVFQSMNLALDTIDILLANRSESEIHSERSYRADKTARITAEAARNSADPAKV